MFRLAHVSDPHLGPLPGAKLAELANKRITGYVNWHRNRARGMTDGVLDRIMADIAAAGVDHLAVTGDLVNLALDGEIELATRWLSTLGEPPNVSVVPGNHDAYVPGAFDKVCKAWSLYMTGDGVKPSRDLHAKFPYIRRRDGVALIGCTSAEATAPFMANGYFREPQARALGRLLDEAGKEGLFRIVMIHHPPVRGAAEMHKRLFGIGRFQKTVLRHGAELVLHGHTHLPTLFRIEGKNGQLPVVGVTATSEGMGRRKPPASWNLIEIEGGAPSWSVTLTRRGLTGQTGIIETLSQELIAGEEVSLLI